MVKINNLEIENVKRVKAVRLQPTENGLTIIGGKNGQGKTSVLDAIAWALGGNKMAPSQAHRADSVSDPKLHIELSNGLVVERGGKKGTLKVLDPTGRKGGQKLLDSFVEQLAINLPKFMEMSATDKGKVLLQIIGVGPQLVKLEQQESSIFNQRTEVGRIAEQKKAHAAEMDYFPDCPAEPVSASELIQAQQEILTRNGENEKKRQHRDQIIKQAFDAAQHVEALQKQLADARAMLEKLNEDMEIAKKSALDLHDESTEELEQKLTDIDELNRKIRVNLDREKADLDAEAFRKQYDDLTVKLTDVRQQKKSLLDSADLPLDGLTVTDGELVYNGQQWDCMSGAEQLKVSTAIVRKLNPECGFVLLDKLEQMDVDTLNEFGTWLEQEHLQAIATRVSTGDECSIVIEDGYVQGASTAATIQAQPETAAPAPAFSMPKF